MVLDEALKLAQEQLAPSNKEGDTVGARFEGRQGDHAAVLHPGFQKICGRAAGSVCITSPEYGGMGLPGDWSATASTSSSPAPTCALLTDPVLTRGAAT